MTPSNILKIKKGISVVLMVLIGFDNTRMVSQEKKWLKRPFKI
jgi:hypothetical protein